MEEFTKEQIAQYYSSAMDSVSLINGEKPVGMSDAEWEDCLNRNKAHLKIVLDKEFWTDEDLTPFEEAIK